MTLASAGHMTLSSAGQMMLAHGVQDKNPQPMAQIKDKEEEENRETLICTNRSCSCKVLGFGRF